VVTVAVTQDRHVDHTEPVDALADAGIVSLDAVALSAASSRRTETEDRNNAPSPVDAPRMFVGSEKGRRATTTRPTHGNVPEMPRMVSDARRGGAARPCGESSANRRTSRRRQRRTGGRSRGISGERL